MSRELKTGLWRHYKGGLYTVVGVATHHESRKPWVLYVSLTYGGLNTRPADPEPGEPDGFLDVLKDGRPRFEYVGILPSDEPAAERGPDAALRMFVATGDAESHHIIAKDQADAEALLAKWIEWSGAAAEYAEQLAEVPWDWSELPVERALMLVHDAGDGARVLSVGAWILEHGRGHFFLSEIG